jgi:hypothetical protein
METPPRVLHRHGLRPIIDRSANNIELNDHSDPGTTGNRIGSVIIELRIGARRCPTGTPIRLGFFLRLGSNPGTLGLGLVLLHLVLIAILGFPTLFHILLALVLFLLVPFLFVVLATFLVNGTSNRTRRTERAFALAAATAPLAASTSRTTTRRPTTGTTET